MDWASTLWNLWGIFWMIFFFGGSIFIHEFGHFIIAKKRGLQVPKFSIGFGPKIFSWKRGETEYCIALFPLGGYVMLPQMGAVPVIEEQGKGKGKGKSKPPAPLKFLDKFLVAIMGAVFNLVLALFLSIILWFVGLRVSAQDHTTIIGYILPTYEGQPTPAAQAGLQKGDEVIAVDDIAVSTFTEIEKRIILGSKHNSKGIPCAKITYRRGDHVHHAKLRLIRIQTNPLSGDIVRFSGIIAPKQDLIIDSFEKGASAEKCGLLKGDKLLMVDHQPLYSFVDLREYLNREKLDQINLHIERNGKHLTLPCDVKVEPNLRGWLHYGDDISFIDFYDRDGSICVLEAKGRSFASIPVDGHVLSCNGQLLHRLEQLEQLLKTNSQQTLMLEIQEENKAKHLIVIPQLESLPELHAPENVHRLGIMFKQATMLVHQSPVAQFQEAIHSTIETLSSLVNKDSDIKVQHLMGAPGIMRLLHKFSTDDFRRLIWFVVLLNINLAILNMLPLPVLDGGHVLFAILEKLWRRPIPARFIMALQTTFVAFFLGLMLYVIFFDLRRWQGDIQMQEMQQRMNKLTIPIQMR